MKSNSHSTSPCLLALVCVCGLAWNASALTVSKSSGVPYHPDSIRSQEFDANKDGVIDATKKVVKANHLAVERSEFLSWSDLYNSGKISSTKTESGIRN